MLRRDDSDGLHLFDLSGTEAVFGLHVRRLRQERGWSQEEVAARVRRRGRPWRQSTQAKIESAQRPVRLGEAAALADVFEMPLDRLIAGLYDVPETLTASTVLVETWIAKRKEASQAAAAAEREAHKAQLRWLDLEREAEEARAQVNRALERAHSVVARLQREPEEGSHG